MLEALRDQDKTTRKALADNVRSLREARGWSQMDLAKRYVFVKQSTVSAIERGVHSATTHTISHLAAALQVAPWMLLVPPDVCLPQHLTLTASSHLEEECKP
jgi:transcriptional regulator with XRE-family HTH domain